MLKHKHIPNVERIHLEQEAGIGSFQLREVLSAFDELSLDAALIRNSNSTYGCYVRVAQAATRGHWRYYDVQIWGMDNTLDVLGPFFYGNTGPEEVHRARVCLRNLKATPGSDLLVETMDRYLAATEPELHALIFGSFPEPEPTARKVGHLTVVK